MINRKIVAAYQKDRQGAVFTVLAVIVTAIYGCRSYDINSTDPFERHAAVSSVTDQDILARVALEDSYMPARRAAMMRLTDQTLLFKVFKECDKQRFRVSAVGKLTDQDLLAKIAFEEIDSDIRLAAVENIIDQNILAKIVMEDKDSEVRFASIKILTGKQDVKFHLLIELLENKDRKIREHVTEALVRIGDPKAVVPIVTWLMPDEPNPETGTLSFRMRGDRSLLQTQIQEFGEAAVDPLITAIRTGSPSMRGYYARALGMLEETASPAIPILIKIFPTAPEYETDAVTHATDRNELPLEAELATRYGKGKSSYSKYTLMVNGVLRNTTVTQHYTFFAPSAAAALLEITGEYPGEKQEDWVKWYETTKEEQR